MTDELKQELKTPVKVSSEQIKTWMENYDEDDYWSCPAQVDIQVKCDELVLFCRTPRSKKEMMDFLKLSDRKSFEKLYIKPLLNKKIRYTIPDKPKSRNQKYVAIGNGETVKD